ncbi:hypothetical protein [Sandaracinus amylolyticus]|uniref:DUF1573 domain-containing protein n=1 Tax=Sandaracinus amylolyticus TaxID=927083 RepID=A0A0F6YFT9_9BACT|nr:hypothetical protein [Sandaracinus amylolyticus]AKF04016.1 hypothetical protein DB32_001165 [Sandaracinus amylolyticus]
MEATSVRDVMQWLVERARTPLVVMASLLGFAELLHGHSLSDAVYRSPSIEARIHLAEHLGGDDAAPVDIEVRNTSDVPCDVEIALSDDLAQSFEQVAMIPEPSPGSPFSVRLERVLPGEERLVALELQGAEPGPHAGRVEITASPGDGLSIPIRTFVTH